MPMPDRSEGPEQENNQGAAAVTAESALIGRIRDGDADAWQTLIDRYEGRLLAYVDSRLRNRAASEDVVQETFVGFLVSLPNFDAARPLESYLFSICGYKLTDHLRREGRRPTLPLFGRESNPSARYEPPGPARGASSIARSGERERIEEQAIRQALRQQIDRWKASGQWTKLAAIESIYVRGAANREVAQRLGLSEQQVANYKSDFQIRMRAIIRRMRLDLERFPELADEP